MYVLTPEQMNQLELNAVECNVSLSTLMQNAGSKMAEFILSQQLDLSRGIVLLCGNGNNGGDGFSCARLLSEAGVPTTAVLMNGEPNTELAMRAYVELAGASADVLNLNDNIEKIFSRISSCVLAVDCCFGIGYHGELPPQVKACMSFVARSGCKKLAADLPSGGNAWTGEVAENTLHCDYTLTFATPKLGMEFSPLREHCGEIVVVDIGIPKEAFRHMDYPFLKADSESMTGLLPIRRRDSYKGDFGKLVIVAGSRRMPGAAAIAVKAGLRSGAGLTTLAAPKTVVESVSSFIFESTFLPLKESVKGEISESNIKDIVEICQSASAVVFGCGVGGAPTYDTQTAILKALLTTANLSCALIIDADGLKALTPIIDLLKDTDRTAKIIITPHVGELAHLLGTSVEDAIKNRLQHAIHLSKTYGITVVAKGVPTFVIGDNGFATINTTGNPGLAKGGSGDALAGIIGAFCAQGLPESEAAAAAVYFHGLAADRAVETLSMISLTAGDVIEQLPSVFREINR